MSTSKSSQAGPGPSSLRNLKPPSRIGMQELDRDAFKLDLPILGIKVKAADIDRYRSTALFKTCLLDVPKSRIVVPIVDDPEYKLLRLRMSRGEDIPSEVMSIIKEETGGLVEDTVTIQYEHWTTHDILASVLPDIEDVPSGFTTTGHIGHMNLRDEWLPYKALIGQVILDKNRNLRTVVNKLNSIHAQYRYFDMEVLAGDKDFITQVSESGCLFTFDFSLVYWNSRLHHEHERIIATLKPDEVIMDVMAGVGPFAVPAAKKGCSVFGNDLNPESVKWMEINRVKNKVQEKLRVSEIDGHAFIKTAPELAWTQPFALYAPRPTDRQKDKAARKEREARKAQGLPPLPATPSTEPAQPQPIKPRLPDHYIMNLPDSALSFLSSFPGSYTSLLSNESFNATYPRREDVPMPLIHVYCFTREMGYEGAERDVLQRASESLGYNISADIEGFELHLVRSVAPQKEMYCLTFRLPHEVAFKTM